MQFGKSDKAVTKATLIILLIVSFLAFFVTAMPLIAQAQNVTDQKLDSLIKNLQDPDPSVRRSAAEALGKLGGTAAVPFLTEALKDGDKDVRYGAAWALGVLGNKTAVPSLIAALKGPDPSVRGRAARALGELGDQTVVPPLIAALKDSNGYVRAGAAEALRELGNKTAVPPLIGALKDPDRKVRYNAAQALGKIGDKVAMQPLIETLKDPDKEVRFEAAGALGKLGDRAAVEPLIKVLKAPDKEMSIRAAWALGDIGEKAVQPLIDVLKDPDWRVSADAAGALGMIGDRAAMQPLIDVLKVKERHYLERSVAARALGEIGDRAAVPVIIEALKNDPNDSVRDMAAGALGEIGDRAAVQLLITVLMDPKEPHYYAAVALGKIGDRMAVPALIEALKDRYGVVRCAAVMALGKIGDKAAVAPLIEKLKHSDFMVGEDIVWALLVREDTVWALGEIRDKAAVPALIEALKDRNGGVRSAAAIALGKIGDRAAVYPLISALKDPDYPVRSMAARALGDIADRAAVQPLIAALKDPNKEARYEAVHALGKLGESIEIYKAFVERSEIQLLNLLRKDSRFDDDGLKQLTGARDPFLKSSGYYLLALRSQQQEDHEKQLEYSKEAMKYIDPRIDTALGILALWLKAEAQIYLLKLQEASGTVKRADDFLTYLSQRERRDFRELFAEYTLLLKGEVLTRNNEDKAAIATYEAALERLETGRKSYWVVKSDVERLQSYVLKALQTAGVGHYTAIGAEGIKLGEQYKPVTKLEMDIDETSYAQQIIQLSGKGNYEEAQRLAEELAMRRAGYLNRNLDIKLADAGKQKTIEEYRSKKKSINALEEKRRDLATKGASSAPEAAREESSELKRVDAEIRIKQRELNNYLVELKKDHPDLAALLGAKPIELKHTQEKLSPETALLQYLILPGKLVIFVIKATTIDIQEEPLPKDLKAKVEQYQKHLKNIEKSKQLTDETRKGLHQIYSDLYEILIRPVQGKLKGITTLGISPNGYLHYVPFGALLAKEGGETKYLIDRYKAIFYVNSTSIFWVATDRAGKGNVSESDLVAYINPDGSLKYAKEEEKELKEIFKNNKIYCGGEAKKEALESMKLSNTVLHFSTHGSLDSRDSSRSFLKMANNRNLTVQDIWGLPLKGNVVTTLSACETSLGELLSGDDIVSLENAFIYAGSPSVVSTLWKVDERATAEVVAAFYRNLVDAKKKMSKAEALTQAQKKVKDTSTHYKDPYFWAGFMLRGTYQ